MLVAARKLSRRYRSGDGWIVALDEVSFGIDDGEFVAVMGPSGSGKTTLMNLIGLLDRPSDGSLELVGRDVSSNSVNQQASLRNQHIGFVFQAFNLLGRSTAIENVELPLLYAGLPRAKRLEQAAEALRSVGLDHRRSHWPTQLSGGEQQRVAIARAIVTDPALILADEPTGALDSKTGQVILSMFQSLNRSGCTIIMVTHDRDVAEHAGRIIEMSLLMALDQRVDLGLWPPGRLLPPRLSLQGHFTQRNTDFPRNQLKRALAPSAQAAPVG